MAKKKKDLHKLLLEYKSINGYADGGDVKPDPSFVDKVKAYFGSTPDAYQNMANTPISPKDLSQGVRNETKPGYADGGEVEDDSSPLKDLAKSIKESFESPKPTPKPTESLDEKYERIRKDNHERAMGTKSSEYIGYASGGKVKSNSMHEKMVDILHHIAKYAEGGEIRNPADDRDIYTKTPIPQQDKKQPKRERPDSDEEIDQLDDQKIAHMADGGDVQPDSQNLTPEQFEQHLQDQRDQGMKLDQVSGAPININGDSGPAKEASMEDPKDADDKNLEENMANEDFKAGEDSDEDDEKVASKDKDDSDEDEESEDDSKDSPRQLDGMTLDKKDAVAQNPAQDDAAGLKVDSSIGKLLAAVGQHPDQLAQAQHERDMNIAGQQIQKGAALMASGASKTNPDRALKMIGDNDKYNDLPMEKYKEVLANQQNDPNSDMSNIMRQFMKSQGFNIPDTASAADISKVAPFVMKNQSLQMQLQKSLAQIMSRQSEGEKNRSAANQRAKDSNLTHLQSSKMLADARQAGYAHADVRQDRTRMSKLGRDLVEEMSSGRSPFGLAAKNVQSIDNVNALLSGTKNLDDLDTRQVYETAKVLDRVLSQSGSTVEGTKGLTPDTAKIHLAKYLEFIHNQRQGANAGSFMQNYQHTFEREKAQALKQLQLAKIKRIAPDKDLFDKYPDQMGDVLESNGMSRDIFNLSPTQRLGTANGPTSQHKPGDIVQVKDKNHKEGKNYKVGADGDSLEEVK